MSRFFEIKALLRNTELPADISIKKKKLEFFEIKCF